MISDTQTMVRLNLCMTQAQRSKLVALAQDRRESVAEIIRRAVDTMPEPGHANIQSTR